MAADLFGLEQAPPRILDRKEAAALVEVLAALRSHAAVAWCERMNSGAARMGAHFVRFGWRGCPDVLGQLKDGRLLGVEVKGPDGKLRPVRPCFWSASAPPVAWHSWPETAATHCASLKTIKGNQTMPNVADEIGANDFDAACLRIQAAAHMVATLCPRGGGQMLGRFEPETDWFPLLNRYYPSRLKFWDAVVRARERTGRHGPAMRRGGG